MRSSIFIKNGAIRAGVAASFAVGAALLIASFETHKANAQGVSIGIGGRYGGILFDVTPREYDNDSSEEYDAEPPRKSRKRSGRTRRKSRKRRAKNYSVDRREKKRIQQALNILGCDAGAVDGRYGRNTREAIKRFQIVLDHDDTGYLSDEEKTKLLAQSDELQIVTKLVVDEKIELSSKFVPTTCGLHADQKPQLEISTRDSGKKEPATTGNATILPDAAPPAASSAETSPNEMANAAKAWNLVKDDDSAGILEAYVDLYGDSIYADLARAKLEKLRQAKID